MDNKQSSEHSPIEITAHRRRGLDIRRISGLITLVGCLLIAAPLSSSYADGPPPISSPPTVPGPGASSELQFFLTHIPGQESTQTPQPTPVVSQQPTTPASTTTTTQQTPPTPAPVVSAPAPTSTPTAAVTLMASTPPARLAHKAPRCKRARKTHSRSRCVAKPSHRIGHKGAHAADFLAPSFTPGEGYCLGNGTFSVSAVAPWSPQNNEVVFARTNFFEAVGQTWRLIASAPWIGTFNEVNGFGELIHEPWYTWTNNTWYDGSEYLSGLVEGHYYAAAQEVYFSSLKESQVSLAYDPECETN